MLHEQTRRRSGVADAKPADRFGQVGLDRSRRNRERRRNLLVLHPRGEKAQALPLSVGQGIESKSFHFGRCCDKNVG